MPRSLATLTRIRVYVVRGDSMSPALDAGQHLLVGAVESPDPALRRGDLVIGRGPQDRRAYYVKRVLGLPGEEVRLLDSLLFINGERLAEPYLGGLPSSLGLGDDVWHLGPGELFVMGDNRQRSTDSRAFGPVPADLLAGKVLFRYWPPRKWGRVR